MANVNICTNGAKAMVAKATGTLAEIKAVAPIFPSVTCVAYQSRMIVSGRVLVQLLSCELN